MSIFLGNIIFARGNRLKHHLKGQSTETREKRGREMYGNQKKRGKEAGFLWCGKREKEEKIYTTLRNILQPKRAKWQWVRNRDK